MADPSTGRYRGIGLLLDSGSAYDYGRSWEVARELAQRPRRVPVVMFTGHVGAIAEAQPRQSARSMAADAARTAALVEWLRAAGAQELSAGTRREWVTFQPVAADPSARAETLLQEWMR